MDFADLWDPEPGWLNTASYGLPPRPGWEALQAALSDWRVGATSWEPWDESTTRSRESFARLVEAAAGIPLVLAGGSRLGDRELLQRMEAAASAGGIGCSVGRNIFMHRSPQAITRALSRVIRERWSADKAFDELQETAPEGAAS